MWLAYVVLYLLGALIYNVTINVLVKKVEFIEDLLDDMDGEVCVVYIGTIFWPFAVVAWIVVSPIILGKWLVEKLVK